MTQAKSQSETPQASFSLKEPLTWGVLGAFALSSFLGVSLLTQLSRGIQEEGARTSTQLVLGLGGAFGLWPLLLASLGVVAGSGLLFVQPRRLRGRSAALAILGALLTLSFAVGALSPEGAGSVCGWLTGAGAFGRLAALLVAAGLGMGTVLAVFEALGLDSSGIRGSLGRLSAVGKLSTLRHAIASRAERASKESTPTATGRLPLNEDTEDSHAVQPSRRARQVEPAVSEPAGEQPAGKDLAGTQDEPESRDVVRPLSRRPGSVAAQPARSVVDVPPAASPSASESSEPKPHVAAEAGDSGLNDLVVRHMSPASVEKRPVIEPDLGETHEPRAMSTGAVEAATSRVGQRTEDPDPGPMAPIATEDPQPLLAADQNSESSAAVAEPPRVSGNAQRVEESESEWAEVEALIATPTAELVDETEVATAEADEEEWDEDEEESAELEEGEWEESEEDEEEEGEWDSAEDDGEWEESEEEEWEEEPATAEASAEAEEDSEEEWEEEEGEEEEWDESAEWEEDELEDEAEESEEPAIAELEEAPEEEPVAADVTTAESLTQNDLFGEAAEESTPTDSDPTPAPTSEVETSTAEAASEPVVELQPAAPDRERMIHEAGLMFIRAERVAVSMLQRTYDMDFDESTAILDELQQRGLIGPYMGGKQRDILMDEAAWTAVVSG